MQEELSKNGYIVIGNFDSYSASSIQFYPEGAIETDWKMMRVGSKGNLKMYMQELKKAEEQGKFRPYVDYEKII